MFFCIRRPRTTRKRGDFSFVRFLRILFFSFLFSLIIFSPARRLHCSTDSPWYCIAYDLLYYHYYYFCSVFFFSFLFFSFPSSLCYYFYSWAVSLTLQEWGALFFLCETGRQSDLSPFLPPPFRHFQRLKAREIFFFFPTILHTYRSLVLLFILTWVWVTSFFITGFSSNVFCIMVWIIGGSWRKGRGIVGQEGGRTTGWEGKDGMMWYGRTDGMPELCAGVPLVPTWDI